MKKWTAIIIVFLLLVASMPNLTAAKVDKQFERDMETYLKEISKKRGQTVTRDDLEYSLTLYEMVLDDFADINELKDFLGEVIKSDSSNLQELYNEFGLTHEEMVSLLQEHGELLEDYIFIDDLYESIAFYLEEKVVRDPDFDKNLETWLKEISKVRGFNVTRDHIIASLAIYEESLENFKTVERVDEFLGEVIRKDLSNLDWVYDMYDLNEKQLLQLLKENKQDINDYVFIDDLMNDLDYTVEVGLAEELAQLMEGYGLSADELKNLQDHFYSLEEELAKEETINRLLEISYRLMEFEEFDTATEITAEQAIELLSIYKELVSIFQVKIEYTLLQSGKETTLSLNDLFKMEKLVNADLKISIYNLQGKFLADLIITGEMVESDTLHDAGGKLNNGLQKTEQTLHTPVKKVKSSTTSSTVKGAKLPATASDYGAKSIGGLIVVLLGILCFQRIRKGASE
ncbi:processed acidic surface protein [Virgibacillus halodenitrificans]|uniref:processed acidic surface protein n=1 Tax=Virgibacillus halodenitrificans TaxID=1482 RepID=UPI000EF55344|nr:processed acidic surface protein [Virgibacillus halodenitrificans]MCG1030095.1 processed acidic surface protein [Virgibacillus halodenitrificans]